MSEHLNPELIADLADIYVPYDSNSPELILGQEVLHAISSYVTRSVIDGSYDEDTVRGSIRDDIVERMPRILDSRLRDEIEWDYRGNALHDYFGLDKSNYGEPAWDNPNRRWQGPLDARLPDEFVDALARAAENLDVDFRALTKIYEGFGSTRLLELTRSISSFYNPSEGAPVPSSVEIFKQVRSSVFDPEFTLSDEEDLYMICIIPPRERRLIKGAVIATHIAQRMDSILGEDMTDSEREFKEIFYGVLRSDAMTGSEWDKFAPSDETSEELSRALVEEAANKLMMLGELQKRHGVGDVERVVEAYKAAKEHLGEAMSSVYDKHKNLYHVANTDTGHGFHSFDSYSLSGVLPSLGLFVRDLQGANKTGERAVIFEDDREQSELWARTVQARFSHTADEQDIYTQEEAVLVRAGDPNSSLFLIDIQNGEDHTAGIRLAEKVMGARLGLLRNAANKEDIPVTKVIIWSSSEQSLEIARQYLGRRFKNNGSIDISGFEGSSSRGGNRLAIDIRSKRHGLTQHDIPLH